MTFQSKLVGIANITSAIFVLAVMDTATKWLTADYTSNQILFFRGFFGSLGICIPTFMLHGIRPFYSKNFKKISFRALCSILGTLCFIYSFQNLPLATVYTIAFGSPLFLTVFSVLLLKEQVSRHRWIAVIVGFIGIIVIVRPGSECFNVLTLLAILGSILYTLYLTLIRRDGHLDSGSTMVIYLMILTIAISLPTLPYFWNPLSLSDIPLFMIVGFGAASGHFLLTQAFRTTDVSVLAPFEYTAILWGTGIGYLVWGDIPDDYLIIGGAMVLGSGAYIIYKERQLTKESDRLQGPTQ